MAVTMTIYLNGHSEGTYFDDAGNSVEVHEHGGPKGYQGDELQFSVEPTGTATPAGPVRVTPVGPIRVTPVGPLRTALAALAVGDLSFVNVAAARISESRPGPLYSAFQEAGIDSSTVQEILTRADEIAWVQRAELDPDLRMRTDNGESSGSSGSLGEH